MSREISPVRVEVLPQSGGVSVSGRLVHVCGKTERGIDKRIYAATAVIRALR